MTLVSVSIGMSFRLALQLFLNHYGSKKGEAILKTKDSFHFHLIR